ncbi:MAG: FAD-binding protein [Lysobacterales bacterium]
MVLATGGIGQLYCHTSNPSEADASGIALAQLAGAETADLEFVQFHPTALAPVEGDGNPQLPLITEAIRGAGAILLNDQGMRFMVAAHPQAELAPRDVVARAVWDQISRGQIGSSLIRVRWQVPCALEFRISFKPAISATLILRVQLIPVVPAAHYHMGGVKVDLHSHDPRSGTLCRR